MNLIKKWSSSVISVHNFKLKCVPKVHFFQILEISFYRILKYFICKQIRVQNSKNIYVTAVNFVLQVLKKYQTKEAKKPRYKKEKCLCSH